MIKRYLLILFFFIFISIFLFSNQKREIVDIKPEVDKFGNITFDDDFSELEKEMVRDFFLSSFLDASIFGEIRFKFLKDESIKAATSGSGVIYLNKELFEKENQDKLKRVVGHEMGHLFDYWNLLDEERKIYSKLREIEDFGNDQSKWFGDYLMHFEDFDNEKWRKLGSEDLAEVFCKTFFDHNIEVKTDYDKNVSLKIEDFLKVKIKESKNYSRFYNYGLTVNSAKKIEEISKLRDVEIIKPVGNYGPFLFLYKREDENELVFISINKEDKNLSLYYSFKPEGYEKYDTYFEKYADEIVYYKDEINYYVLNNQGNDKDFQLFYNGNFIVMKNDNDLNKYDILEMMGNSNSFGYVEKN